MTLKSTNKTSLILLKYDSNPLQKYVTFSPLIPNKNQKRSFLKSENDVKINKTIKSMTKMLSDKRFCQQTELKPEFSSLLNKKSFD